METLGLQEQFWIRQVAATMAIEDMMIDDQTYGYLVQIASGEKAADQVISKIKKEYIANG